MEAYLKNATAAAGDAAATATALPLDMASWFVLACTLVVFFGPLFVLFPPFPPRRSDALYQTHTKLGIVKPSKSKTTRSDDDNSKTAQARVHSLFVYPVESCTGIEVTRAKVAATGFEYDRLYTFAQLKSPFPVAVGDEKKEGARDHKWETITQDQFPLLSTLQIELWQPDLDKLKGLNDKNAQSNSEAFLILRFPWREPGFFGLWDLFAAKCLRGLRAVTEKEVLLPVEFPTAGDITAKRYTRETVHLQGSSSSEKAGEDAVVSAAALDLSVELPEELRLYLGVSNKLGIFRATPEASTELAVQSALVGKEKTSDYKPVVGFHDSYPVHIVNVPSAMDLGSREVKGLNPHRKGANVFVSGLPAGYEVKWSSFKAKPGSASQDSEVSFRGGPGKDGVGVHMIPLFDEADSSHGFLEVGMSVEVLEQL